MAKVDYKQYSLEGTNTIEDATYVADLNFNSLYDELGKLSILKILDGRLITGIALIGGATSHVEHGLGRAYFGYIPVKGISSSANYPTEQTSDDSSKWVALQTTTDATIDIWVF